MRTALAVLLAAASAAAASPPEPSLDTILNRMQHRRERQNAALCGYTCLRAYTIRNKHLSRPAVMTYRVTTDRATGKHFKLISKQGIGFLVRHAIETLVNSEPRTRKEEQQGEVDRANYRFALLGEAVLNGHRCFVLRLSPRRKSKYLVDGEAWVDVQCYAVRQIKGQLAKSVSFWVGKTKIQQTFADFDGFWMSSVNSSVSYVKLVGDTTVTIQFSDWKFQRCGP